MSELAQNITMAARFAAFDAKYPEVWEMFKRFTNEIIALGKEHYSADAVLHRIRWETAFVSTEQFKINNIYSAFFARKFHREFPQYDGFFMTCVSRADFERAEPVAEVGEPI